MTLCFTLCVLLNCVGSLRAQSAAPLTLEQAVALAKARNPSLQSAGQHLAATRAAQASAAVRVNPSFTLSGSNVNLPANNPSNPYTYNGNVSRLFERGQKRRWRMDVARDTTEVTRSQYNDQERQTVLAVKQAFSQMLAAKGALGIAQDNLNDYRKTVELTRARLDAGDVSATDYERIDLQLAQFESDYDNARLALTQASDQLQLLLGYERPSAAFDIAGSLAPPPLNLDLATLEQQALAARPDYRAAHQSVLLADDSVKLAEAYGTTDPTIGGEYERVGIFDTAGFQLNIPLRIFDRNQGEKARTRYEAQSSRFAEAAAHNQVTSDVDQAWAAYQAALALAGRYNGHYLQEATHVRDNLQFSYRHGGSTLLDYLNALEEYRQTNLDALNANLQVWLSLHQLSFATATEVLP